ncbi:t3pks [Curvularia kusanoi]|uniref:T3pks n=1 Tax=Curvularia kusanoi TaxID=90978 RepID=A0A9P4W4M0_CURKU|nr:t3pks [Curvularia kusanoi]
MVLDRYSSVYITGLAHQYPPHSLTKEESVSLINRLASEHMSSPGFCKLQAVIQKNEIRSRPTILDCASWTEADATPPAIDELSQVFRTLGVDMTVSACNKALKEAQLLASDVTHVVAVTCTDQGSPGYDLSVTRKLLLDSGVQRTLLHGVGCAGGLSALREAANLAVAATARNRPARILVFATELCSLFLRAEMQAACSDNQEVHIALSLFSDASAALVVCNDMGLTTNERPIYKLQEWSGALLPGTEGHMSYCVSPSGMIATITRDVPKAVVGAVSSMFSQICGSSHRHLEPTSFDWAIHPGGLAILRGAQLELGLTDDHIRDSLEVYQQCAALWEQAFINYNQTVEKEGSKRNLRLKLDQLNVGGLVQSVDEVKNAVDDSSKAFQKYRHSGTTVDKVREYIGKHLSFVSAVGDNVVASASAAFPPAGAIWTVSAFAIKACQAQSEDYGQLLALIGETGNFLKTIKIIEAAVPDCKGYTEFVTEALTAIIGVFAVQTKFMLMKRPLVFLHTLVRGGGDSDLAAAYARVTEALNRLSRANEMMMIKNTEDIKNLAAHLGERINFYNENIMIELAEQAKGIESNHEAILVTHIGIEANQQGIQANQQLLTKMLGILQSGNIELPKQAKGARQDRNDTTLPINRVNNEFKTDADPELVRQELARSYVPDSAAWFFETQQYQQWLSNDKPFVSFMSEEGEGKSHVAYAVLQQLEEQREVDSGTSVAYFFFQKERPFSLAEVYALLEFQFGHRVLDIEAEVSNRCASVLEISNVRNTEKHARDLQKHLLEMQLKANNKGVAVSEIDTWDKQSLHSSNKSLENEDILLEAQMQLSEIIYNQFLASSNIQEKRGLLREMESLGNRRLGQAIGVDSAKGTYSTNLARMYQRLGPSEHFFEILDAEFRECMDKLGDKDPDNDRETLRQLCKILACVPGLNRDAEIALSASFYNIDPTLESQERSPIFGEGVDSASSDGDTDAASEDLSASGTQDDNSVAFSDDESCPEDVDDSNPQRYGHDTDGESDDDSSLSKTAKTDGATLLAGDCAGCGNSVWMMWNHGPRSLFWCVICASRLLCGSCVKSLDKSSRYCVTTHLDAVREPLGSLDPSNSPDDPCRYCVSHHSLVKMPMEGWIGIKDGEIRIENSDPTQVKEWLRRLSEEQWPQAWEKLFLG